MLTPAENRAYLKRYRELQNTIDAAAKRMQASMFLLDAFIDTNDSAGIDQQRFEYHTQIDILLDAQIEQKKLVKDTAERMAR